MTETWLVQKSPHPCYLSWGRMVSVSFVSVEKYELQMRKNFSTFFFIHFLPKKPSLKKILTPILSENVAYETLVNYTKPWTLYLILVLRNRGSNIKIVKNSVFSKLLFKKTMEPNFFEIFFRRKCSPGTCATFSGNMVSVSVMGFEKFAAQVWKVGTCHEICEKKT